MNTQQNSPAKKLYRSPELTIFGPVSQLTQNRSGIGNENDKGGGNSSCNKDNKNMSNPNC